MITRFIIPLIFLLGFQSSVTKDEPPCDCDHIVGLDRDIINGLKTPVKPGDVICIRAGRRKNFQVANVDGDSLHPVKIINCGGRVEISNLELGYGLKLENCRYIHLTGTGDKNHDYGFLIDSTKAGASGLTIGKGSSDFEVDHLEITHSGFAGIMAKTDPNCDGSYARGTFVQKNVAIHDNFIHHVKGEGLYIGNSFYSGWTGNKKCLGTVLYPHDLKNIKIYNNIILHTDWDGMQLGCAVSNAEIFDNRIDSFGIANIPVQGNGIQVGGGTTGSVYNNRIVYGTGNGIIVLGIGNNYIYNNLIADCGGHGIFDDNRVTLDSSKVMLINNTILNPKGHGIKMMNEVTDNYILNNLIVKTGNASKDDFFILFGDKAKAKMAGNFTSNNKSLIEPLFENQKVKEVVGKGVKQDYFSVDKDISGKTRKNINAPDPGCLEF